MIKFALLVLLFLLILPCLSTFGFNSDDWLLDNSSLSLLFTLSTDCLRPVVLLVRLKPVSSVIVSCDEKSDIKSCASLTALGKIVIVFARLSLFRVPRLLGTVSSFSSTAKATVSSGISLIFSSSCLLNS